MSIEPKRAIRLATGLKAGTIESEAIHDILNDAAAVNLAELAAGFGVSPATIRAWRESGLPGDGKSRRYKWGDVLIWWLDRVAKRNRRGESSGKDARKDHELAMIEIETARANLDFRRARAARLSDEYLHRRLAQTELATALAVIRETIMGLADTIKPRLPADQAEEIAADVDRTCRRTLHGLADRLARIAAEQTENGVNKNDKSFNR